MHPSWCTADSGRAPGLACISSTVGMACSTAAGHGFVINRTAVLLK